MSFTKAWRQIFTGVDVVTALEANGRGLVAFPLLLALCLAAALLAMTEWAVRGWDGAL